MFNPEGGPQNPGEAQPQPEASQESAGGENLNIENNAEASAEKTPGVMLDTAFSRIEKWDSADPIMSIKGIRDCRNWVVEKKAQADAWCEKKGEEHPIMDKGITGLANLGILGGAIWTKTTKFGLLKFIWKFLKNKGNMTFAEGYEIGKDMLDFEGKKSKG